MQLNHMIYAIVPELQFRIRSPQSQQQHRIFLFWRSWQHVHVNCSHIICTPPLLNWWRHPWLKSIPWSRWGLPPSLPGVSLNFCLPYWKSRNFICSGKWSHEKYALDDSLNVTRISGGRGLKYEMKKKLWPPPYTCLAPPWPPHS